MNETLCYPVRVFVSSSRQTKAISMTMNRNLTTMSTAGLLLPIAPASSSEKLEDGPGHYQHLNRTPSLPFLNPRPNLNLLMVSSHPLPQAQLQSQQSQLQSVISEASSHSDSSCSLSYYKILYSGYYVRPRLYPRQRPQMVGMKI